MLATQTRRPCDCEQILRTQFGVHVNQSGRRSVPGWSWPRNNGDADLYASRARRSLSLIYLEQIVRGDQRALSGPLQIRPIDSVQFPENAASPIAVPADLPLNSFPLALCQLILEENHEAAQISIWIFDQEEKQIL